MSESTSTAREQNDELLRLIASNKARLAQLQKTIAELQTRTEDAGEAAHFWVKHPKRPEPEPAGENAGKSGG